MRSTLAGFLLCVAAAMGAAARADAPPTPRVLATDPVWIVAGKPERVQFFGTHLAAKEIRFQDARIHARVLSVEARKPKDAEDAQQRGDTVVTAEVTAPATLPPQEYPLQLAPVQGAPTDARLYVDLPAPEIPEKEPNDSLAEPQALPAGSVTVLGKLDGSGVDVFRIEAKAGETWRFEVFARRIKPTNPLEAVLRLRDGRSFAPLRVAVDRGHDCFIQYRAPADGPYLIELFDGDARSGPEMTYRLAVRRLP